MKKDNQEIIRKKVSLHNIKLLSEVINCYCLNESNYYFYPNITILGLKQSIEIQKCFLKSLEKGKLFPLKIHKNLINYLIQNVDKPELVSFLYVFV